MANGRPRPARINRHKNLGPLHDLLLKACVPEKKTRKKSITVLAKDIGFTNWGCYLWIKKGRLPAARAKQVVDLHAKYANRVDLPQEERVSLHDFDDYVFGR